METRRRTLRIMTVASSAGLALCASLHAVEAQATAARITRDSIGTLPLQLPLTELVERYPTGKRVAWRGEGVGYPAFAFRIGALRVWAVQEREPAEGADTIPDLDLTKPADFFAIEGSGGILPGGASTASRWAKLRRTLGHVVVFAEPGYPLHVRPCRYPWLTIGLEGRRTTPRSDGTIAPTRLSDTARATDFRVRTRDAGAAPHPRCRGS